MSALSTTRDLKSHFIGLANPTRLAIVALLAQREMPGAELARRLKLSQPLLSWHLRIMRRAHIIETRRSGRKVTISLDRKAIGEFQQRFNQFIGQTGGAEDESLALGDRQEVANAI